MGEVRNSFSQIFEVDKEFLITGTKVNYFFHCKTQLWFFSHFVTREKDSELVLLGKILESSFLKSIKSNNINVDQRISIDFLKRGKGKKLLVCDIKKSSKFKKAHYYQMLYYLWYLKNINGITNIEGLIIYPKEKKNLKVKLTQKKEEKIVNILKEIKEVISQPKPPQPTYKKYCRKCAYFELCFGD